MIEQTEAGSGVSPANVFVARQPIFGKGRQLEGYELLYRSSATVGAVGSDDDQATMGVISASLIQFGLEKLVGSKRAYINFTEALLQDDTAMMLPPDGIVVEIPNTISSDSETVDACRRLKDKGYVLALDNFMFQPAFEQLLGFADIVKVDFLNAQAVERAKVAQSLISRGVTCLAHRVETYSDCAEAEQLGYTLFQGFFFCRPSVMAGRSLSTSSMVCLEAFREVCKPEIDFDRVAEIVKRDVSFTYKLLRFVNSAALGLRTRIHSIKQALLILGSKESARWLSLVALRDFGSEKPDELVMTCIVRARMGETLAKHVGMRDRASDAFLMGVFSAIDAFVDRPVNEVIADLPLAQDVQAALLGEPNPLRELLDMILAYERGDWPVVSGYAGRHHLDKSVVPDLYVDAIAWANEFFPDLQSV